MKRKFQAGRGGVRGKVVTGSLVLLVLSPFMVAENRDPLTEARAVMAQRRDEADQRRGAEDPGGWSKLTNRPASPFQRNRADEVQAAQMPKTAQGPSPFNPKFGAPTFQMPSTPAQDASAPQLKQFHPTAEPGAEVKERKFLAREAQAEKEGAEGEEGRKSTLSYTGEDAAKDRMRSYDEIYQSKSPYALPAFQMPAGPAAALAAPGAQTWGGRVLTQYRPETEAGALERARMQREQRDDAREVRREEEPAGIRNLFDRTKRLESR